MNLKKWPNFFAIYLYIGWSLWFMYDILETKILTE